jgi:hypothetical protein
MADSGVCDSGVRIACLRSSKLNPKSKIQNKRIPEAVVGTASGEGEGENVWGSSGRQRRFPGVVWFIREPLAIKSDKPVNQTGRNEQTKNAMGGGRWG